MKKFIYSLGLVFFLGTTLKAQDANFTNAGSIELGGGISFLNQKTTESSSSVHVFSFNPYIGGMIVKGFELGMIPGVTIAGTSGEHSATDVNFFIAPAYNFNAGRVYPFVEFLIGYCSSTYGSSKSGGLGVGGSGGVKVQIGSNGNLIFNLQYVNKFYKYSGSSSSIGVHNLSMEIGYRIFIAKK